MATIAKGMITLSSVNDAFSVLLSPNSCVINADWDGNNPRLDNAYTDIRVYQGDAGVEFPQPVILGYSHEAITATVTKLDDKAWRIKFATVDTSSLNGKVNLKIVVGAEFTTTISFGYTVVRETSMLDWILDWEGREKTEIAGEHIITPKIFVGKSENGGQLTGTYIGPAFNDSGRIGVFGYLTGVEIFHLDNTGGSIGGWNITSGGIQTADGYLKILSEGSIISAPDNTLAWKLNKDGSATFAKGNVNFFANGDAEFAGKITSKYGSIGGWNISQNQLNSRRVIIDSNKGYIGINASPRQVVSDITNDISFPETPTGGVKMWGYSANDFGFAGWAAGNLVFELGAYNMIAGWQFNHQAIWTGSIAPSLTQGAFTAEDNSLTIAPNGIRSNSWYVDADGTASFVSGLVQFNTEDAEMFGWLMRNGRFSSQHAALISEPYYAGLYITSNDISEVGCSELGKIIGTNGGIYLYSDGSDAIMRAFDKDGNICFSLSTSGNNRIGDWWFNNENLYLRSQNLNAAGFTSGNEAVVLGNNGLIGTMWKLLADGSGALAGGNIKWEKTGEVTFSDKVSLSWSNITNAPNLTKIDANGMYTGTISADNITAGTISTASIKCEGKWALNTDGSGYLAAQNIIWTSDGNLELYNIKAHSGKIGGFQINNSTLVNDGFDDDATIIFRNDNYKIFGAMGGNTLPISSGLRAVARFENEDPSGTWYQRNIALALSAKNGRWNHAFIGTGNGTLNGWIAGFRFDRFTLVTGDTIYSDYVNLRKNNHWLCKATASNTGIILPTLNQVQDALGCDSTTPFCVELVILADIGSTNFYIYGRTDRKDSSNKQPWNTEQYPVFVNYNGDRWERQTLSAGDCFSVWLIYDPDETQKIGNYTCQYTARTINHIS